MRSGSAILLQNKKRCGFCGCWCVVCYSRELKDVGHFLVVSEELVRGWRDMMAAVGKVVAAIKGVDE